RGYVSLESGGAIALTDAQHHKSLRLTGHEGEGNTPKPRAMGIAVAPDGSTVYVTTGSFGSLFFVDPAKNASAGAMPVGQRPWGVAVLPDGKTIFTANGPSNDVSVVDVATRQGVRTIKGGERPWGIAVISLRSPAVKS